MKTLLVTRYHAPTIFRGPRISVRGFVPGKGVVRKTYPFTYSGNAHNTAATQFIFDFLPGCKFEQVNMPLESVNQTGNAYIVTE
jgi:hypothetical protein